MGKKAKLLWMDLEMTGLCPEKDRILEVAIVATDWKFQEIDTYFSAVSVPEQIIAERMTGDFWERNPESYAGLVQGSREGKESLVVQQEIMEFIEKNFGKEIYLAGNSIHQDRRFIAKEWVEIDRKLHYRMFDVSAWKIYFDKVLGKKFVKPDAHRAIDDIRGSIEEIKYYLSDVRGSGF